MVNNFLLHVCIHVGVLVELSLANAHNGEPSIANPQVNPAVNLPKDTPFTQKITKNGPKNRKYSLAFSPSVRVSPMTQADDGVRPPMNDFWRRRFDIDNSVTTTSRSSQLKTKNQKKSKRNKKKSRNSKWAEKRSFLDDLPDKKSWWRSKRPPSPYLNSPHEEANSFDVPPFHTLPIPERLRTNKKRPNIVLIMTDDLDIELGSLNYMPKLLRTFGEGGAMFSNAYTSTPMCCPSRSSMLTGMYIHNHHVYTNHQNCSSTVWQDTHERRSFASYLNNAGYKTGYFGKYLNRYSGHHVPPGWQDWGGLIMNSRYYNYSVNRNNVHVKYGNRYPQDYYPHVVTKDGLNFLKTIPEEDPFLLVLSYPAPHGPEDSAPEHAHKFFNASDHHTAAYNYAPNPDKQWVLQFTDRMPQIQLKFTDLLMTKRLQTLQTIDTAIETVLGVVDDMGETDNTYFFFTSDHGYHLGQYGLTKGKAMPFEFDIKVPFLVKGPEIKANIKLPQIALNVDLAPTFLDIAGLPRPPHMDGRSLLPILKSSSTPEELNRVPWRDSFLVESSGRVREEEVLEKKEQRTWERERALTMTLLEASSYNSNLGPSNSSDRVNLYTSKHERLEEVCKRPEFAHSCTHDQKWHCVRMKKRWKIKKCRQRTAMWQKHCVCNYQQGLGTFTKLEQSERRKQKNFLKKYASQDFHRFDSKFVKAFTNIDAPSRGSMKRGQRRRAMLGRRRFGRSVPPGDEAAAEQEEFLESSSTGDAVHSFVEEEEIRDLEDQILELSEELEILKEVEGHNASLVPDLEHWSPSEECSSRTDSKSCEGDSYPGRLGNVQDRTRRLKQQLAAMKNILLYFKNKNDDLEDFTVFDDYDQDFYSPSSSSSSDDDKTSSATLKDSVPPDISIDMSHLFKNLNESLHLVHTDPFKKSSNKEDEATLLESETAFGSSRKLFPINMSDLNGGMKIKGRYKVCWCNEKILRKIEIRRARERRRRERLDIKSQRTRKKRRKKKEKALACNYPKLNCYTHDNHHWKTPPLWKDGNFCFCINSANNTYWCLRTINETHNFLYCEFITGLITYYDLHIDPYQLRNVAFTLSTDKVVDLHRRMTRLRSCKGADECDGYVTPAPPADPVTEEPPSEEVLTKFLVADGDLVSNRFDKLSKRAKMSERRIKKEKRRRKQLHNEMLLLEQLGSFSPMDKIRQPRRSRHNRKERKQRRHKKNKQF